MLGGFLGVLGVFLLFAGGAEAQNGLLEVSRRFDECFVVFIGIG